MKKTEFIKKASLNEDAFSRVCSVIEKDSQQADIDENQIELYKTVNSWFVENQQLTVAEAKQRFSQEFDISFDDKFLQSLEPLVDDSVQNILQTIPELFSKSREQIEQSLADMHKRKLYEQLSDPKVFAFIKAKIEGGRPLPGFLPQTKMEALPPSSN